MVGTSLSIGIVPYNRDQITLHQPISELQMSKLFFKGRIDARQNHVISGYNVNRDVKAGTDEAPINVVVSTDARKTEIETLLSEHSIVAHVVIDSKQPENTIELDTLLNKPKTITYDKTPNRNEPCICGSGKKYKKCCA